MVNHYKLDISIVTYNSELVIARCLRSVLSVLTESNVISKIFVVDNNSSDKTCDIVSSTINDFQTAGGVLTLLAQVDNGGWSKGHNVALAHSDADIVLLLNPDALLTTDIAQSMITAFEHNAQLGALSPILESNGILLPGDFSNHVPWKEIIRAVFPFRNRNRGSQFNKSSYYTQWSAIVENRYLTGACLFVKKDALEATGYRLDERYFMYADDEDLCRTIVKAGFEIAVLRQGVLEHSGEFQRPKLGNE